MCLRGQKFWLHIHQVVQTFSTHLVNDWMFWNVEQGSLHVQACVSAQYTKTFGRYAAEIADMHHFSSDALFLIRLLFIAKTVRSLSQWSRETYKVIIQHSLQAYTPNTLCLYVSMCIITQSMHWNSHHRKPVMRRKWRRATCILFIVYRRHIYTTIHLENEFPFPDQLERSCFSKDGHK